MKTSAKRVKLENLSKTFITSTRGEVKAVQHIDLNIEPGEFVTLLGPSGCGKTTILRMVAGFEPPTEGAIYIGEKEVSALTPDKRDLGMVFQNYALFPHLNVFNNIGYGLKLKKLPAGDIKKRVEGALELVQMDDFSSRVPSQMSGGQQQRVALVRALVMHPGVLLFDEPLSNLDAKLRVHMRDEIRKIQKEVGITTIYVTHDQSEAMAVSDKVVIINQGVIHQVGSPQEVYQRPRDEFVANFIGRANILDATIIDKDSKKTMLSIHGTDFAIAQPVAYSKGESVKIVVRPESIIIGDGPFSARVAKSIYMGDNQDYDLDFDGTNIMATDFNPVAKTVFSEQEKIHFSFDEKSVYIL